MDNTIIIMLCEEAFKEIVKKDWNAYRCAMNTLWLIGRYEQFNGNDSIGEMFREMAIEIERMSFQP